MGTSGVDSTTNFIAARSESVISPPEDYRIIPLSNSSLTVKVSSCDYDSLSQFTWHLAYGAKNGHPYARRTIREGSKCHAVWMHRQVLGLERGDKRWSDHINSIETLDNRRENLRCATPSQNNMHRRSTTGTEKGVNWHKLAGKWRARIKINRKEIHLGLFSSREEAVTVRGKAMKKFHGEFARAK